MASHKSWTRQLKVGWLLSIVMPVIPFDCSLETIDCVDQSVMFSRAFHLRVSQEVELQGIGKSTEETTMSPAHPAIEDSLRSMHTC
jgi:hypothetical protein